jgi:hypothetical protein
MSLNYYMACACHRLELCDTVKAVSGVNRFKSFIDKLSVVPIMEESLEIKSVHIFIRSLNFCKLDGF